MYCNTSHTLLQLDHRRFKGVVESTLRYLVSALEHMSDYGVKLVHPFPKVRIECLRGVMQYSMCVYM